MSALEVFGGLPNNRNKLDKAVEQTIAQTHARGRIAADEIDTTFALYGHAAELVSAFSDHNDMLAGGNPQTRAKLGMLEMGAFLNVQNRLNRF